jgi:hypothetical protein
MPDFGDIAIDLAHVDIPTRSGQALTIWYRPGAITPRMSHQARRWAGVAYDQLSEQDQQDALDSTSRTLEAMVDSWTLENRGVPVVPTVEGLLDIPYNVQRVLIEAIMAAQSAPKAAPPAVDSTPPAPAATGSANTAASSTPAPSAAPLAISSPDSRSGTASTPLPSGLASPSSPFPMSPSGGSNAPPLP